MIVRGDKPIVYTMKTKQSVGEAKSVKQSPNGGNPQSSDSEIKGTRYECHCIAHLYIIELTYSLC